MIQKKPLLFLMGPTASGKTGLSLDIAQRFNLEIINTDSVQVYKEFTIGAAKPSPAEQARVVHHLLDLVSAKEVFSADRFRQMAWDLVERLNDRQVVPLLVGGSGLYFRAVEKGLACMPPLDGEIREQIRLEGERLGWPIIHERLKQVDPTLAARLPPKDSQRICHGLTVFLTTGKTLSQWHQEQPPPPPFTLLKMALDWPRDLLNERINARFDQMIDEGFLEEAETILQQFDRDHPAMKAVGYRQLFAYLDGTVSREEAIEWGKRESRRYAKRQMTWLRREENLNWIPWDQTAHAHMLVEQFLAQQSQNPTL
ncbi:MAG: tRNA (adenosine(37)-N6)-dimethylallyltransferase MiaA [Magnetococcales bacterium]|nr:tRNA (adenosine(37)-N6)-dimethylallyltransferase MiaA [Magnetococcales bacterium]